MFYKMMTLATAVDQFNSLPGYSSLMQIKAYMEENELTYSDVLTNYNMLTKKLKQVEQKLHEMNYEEQIETSYKIVPQTYEVIITDDAIIQTEHLSLSNSVQLVKSIAVKSQYIALKYELKYILLNLNELLKNYILFEGMNLE